MSSLFDRSLFEIADGVIHLGAGGETPFLKSHLHAFASYVPMKGNGMVGREKLMEAADAARMYAADFFDVKKEEIGFAGSVADGCGILVESMDWQPGDRVILARGEFPSLAVPLALCPRVTIAEAAAPDPASFAAAATTGRARVIAISYVSYVDGRRVDLKAFRDLADKLGAELWVDFTQAAGALPVDLPITDFAFSSCYKWMLGTTGTALCYWNRQRRPDWRTRAAGWGALKKNAPFDAEKAVVVAEDASAFTRGNPAHLPLFILNNALRFLQAYDIRDIERHVQTLTQCFMDELTAENIAFATPRSPAAHGASVCLFSGHAGAIAAKLQQRGVFAWAAHGRLRFSFHGYNNISEVRQVVAHLKSIVGESERLRVSAS
jgi:selenocysteine lyase/cysteine desulfurase